MAPTGGLTTALAWAGRPRTRVQAVLGVLTVVGLVIAAAGFSAGSWASSGRAPDRGVVPGVDHIAAPTIGAAASTRPPLRPPTSFRAPSVGIAAPVIPVATLPDGGLDLPDDVLTVGWWSGGALPGSGHGTVVIAGHVDDRDQGAGALFHLDQIPLGTRVALTSGTEIATYEVRAVRSYAKSDLPSDAFADTGPERLVLITCGGPFDGRTRHYADNVVVYAVPTPPVDEQVVRTATPGAGDG